MKVKRRAKGIFAMTGKINKPYFYSVLLLMFIAPAASIVVEAALSPDNAGAWHLIGKWFVFWAVGVRLLTAGMRQALNPSFTAVEIFHAGSGESHPVVRELGFANICLGLGGVFSLFVPSWRQPAALSGGFYLGIAGIQHVMRRPAGGNERVAMVTDLFAFLIAAFYLSTCL
jgi:hypothetical protein